jgi:hypothetical protein
MQHHRRDDHDRPAHREDHGAGEREEPVFTTLAVGEEGDPDPLPEPIGSPEEPVFTTLAVGEEGGEPEPGWPVFTTFAVGEEGDPSADDPWCA